jgi:hypothetical protein
MGIRQSDKQINESHGLAQTKQVGYYITRALLVHEWTTGKHELTRLSTAWTWGKPPPSPYSIICAWPRDQHLNVILSRDSQLGVLGFPKLKPPQLWGPITLCADLILRWSLKQSCSSRRELSNCMLHARKSGWFLTFNGRESNCQFDFWP